MEYICDIGISNDGVIVRRSHVREKIVRCRDCENYCAEDHDYAIASHCTLSMIHCGAHDFCSFGVSK